MSVKTPVPSYPAAVQIIASMTTAQGSNLFTQLVPLADAQVPKLIKAGLEIDAVSTITEGIVQRAYTGGPRDLALVEELTRRADIPTEARDAIGGVQFMHAEAGFALGLALGLRLGGVGR